MIRLIRSIRLIRNLQSMKTQKLFLAALITILLAQPILSLAQGIETGFDPNKIIDDKIFSDTQTFGGPEGVQKFLEVKGSILANTSPDFIAKLKEPDITMLKQGLEDPRPNLGRMRTAAELIWDASIQSGLNPQVIIVTLNKEQSLITGHQDSSPDKMQKALDRAMGFDCPDATGCGNLFPGFYYQLFGNFDSDGNRYLGAAKSLMKSFNTDGGRGPQIDGHISRVGDVVTLDNTMGGFDGVSPSQTITIMNRATAALYRFTPHVFNGNYNFWRFFNSWFRYPNGTLLSLAGDIKTYIIQNGTKQLVPDFVAKARNLNLASKITISPNEYDSYPTDKVFGPKDDTIVKTTDNSKTYVFINNIKHPASSFVISQRGLNPTQALEVSSSEASLFDTGNVLPPKDGTIIRGVTNPAIYLVDGGRIKLFSEYTFKQRKIAAKQVTPVPDDEITTYEKQGFVPPLDNTLIKSTDKGTVYLVDKGLKRPVTAELFKNRGFKVKDVVSLSPDEVTSLTVGAYATPKDKTFFKVAETGQLYMFKEGSKHPISSFVAKQRGITPDYTFGQSMAYEWYDGISIPPKDNTLVKGAKDGTVYLVSKGQLRPLTAKAFKARKYNIKNIKTLPQDEVDAYAKGDVVNK